MITFRKPEMSDLAVMFAWQQHPETRMTSPKHQYPSWEKFMVTARGYVEDLDEMFQLMCVDGHPVGFIVFQQAEHGIWFGTRVAPGLHERGFEVTLVEHAKQRFGSKLAMTLHSEAEQKAFGSLGFEREGESDVFRYRG